MSTEWDIPFDGEPFQPIARAETPILELLDEKRKTILRQLEVIEEERQRYVGGESAEQYRCPTITEALAEPQPELSWILPDLFPVGGIWVMASEGGVGKSTLIVQALACLSSGRPFLAWTPVRALRCLILEAEGSRPVFLDRIKVALHHLGHGDGADLPLHVAPRNFAFDLTDKGFRAALLATAPDVCVLDTVGLFHDGDENSNTDFKARVVKPLREIAALLPTPISWVLVHHQAKPSEMRKGRHTIRGASAMVDDSDLTTRLTAPDGDKAPARLLHFEKVRYGPPVSDMPLVYDGTTATFAQEDAIAAEADAAIEQDRNLRDWCERVRTALQRHDTGLSGRQIRELSGLSGIKWTAAKEAMEKAGTIRYETREGRGGGVVWHLVK